MGLDEMGLGRWVSVRWVSAVGELGRWGGSLMGLDEMGLGRWVSVRWVSAVGELAGELRDEGGTRRLERKKNFEEEERRKKRS